MATQMLSYRLLKAAQVKTLNWGIEGSASVARDEGLLQSALASPENQQHYDGINDVTQLAATLSVKLIMNHAFGNGNKRTALLAANLFLLQNGRALQQNLFQVENNVEITEAHDAVAENRIGELELAAIYKRNWRKATKANLGQAASLFAAQ
jgi:death-on-curing family protein